MDQSFVYICLKPRGGKKSTDQHVFEETLQDLGNIFVNHFLRNSTRGALTVGAAGGESRRAVWAWRPACALSGQNKEENPASYFIWRRVFTETISVLQNKRMAAFWEWGQHRYR